VPTPVGDSCAEKEQKLTSGILLRIFVLPHLVPLSLVPSLALGWIVSQLRVNFTIFQDANLGTMYVPPCANHDYTRANGGRGLLAPNHFDHH